MYRIATVALFASLAINSANAQVAPPPQPTPAEDPSRNLIQDWQSMATQLRHVDVSMMDLVRDYQKIKAENEKLKAELAKLAPPPTPAPAPTPPASKGTP